jgi:hypothetical protein
MSTNEITGPSSPFAALTPHESAVVTEAMRILGRLYAAAGVPAAAPPSTPVLHRRVAPRGVAPTRGLYVYPQDWPADHAHWCAACASYGVERVESTCSDDFIGTHSQLVGLGVARADQFPGQPGMGKMMTSWSPDGARRWKGQSGGNLALQIHRRGKDRFAVLVTAPAGVREQRLAVLRHNDLAARDRRNRNADDTSLPASRLALVWSRSDSQPGSADA